MKKYKINGFSMLEVLITLVIILLGVLGMAGMQMLAINNTQIARTHSLAAIMASSLTAQMQANESYWTDSTISTSVLGANKRGWESSILSNSTLNGQSIDCTDEICTPVAMAGYDLKKWGADLATLLPSGKATVTCSGPTATAPNVCTISVSWTEQNVALHNQNNASTTSTALTSGTVSTQTYTTFSSIH